MRVWGKILQMTYCMGIIMVVQCHELATLKKYHIMHERSIISNYEVSVNVVATSYY